MTEKRYVVKGNWIEDRCIGKLLNIDFNTITDAVLCCDLLNDIENKKAEYGKIASKYLEENEQLKHKLKSLNDNFNHLKRLFDEIEEPISDELLAEYSRIVVEGFND